MNFEDKTIETPENLPMLPVRDLVVFPYMILPLFVGRESSISAVEEALTKKQIDFPGIAERNQRREPKP